MCKRAPSVQTCACANGRPVYSTARVPGQLTATKSVIVAHAVTAGVPGTLGAGRLDQQNEYKTFPPGLGHIFVPTTTRADALTGLSLYGPCRTRSTLMHRTALWLVESFGPRALPGRVRKWVAPMPEGVWTELLARWQTVVGEIDGLAVYQRRQAHRAGVMLLLLNRGKASAFVRLRHLNGEALEREHEVLTLIAAQPLSTFIAPTPLARGEYGDWHYLVTNSVFTNAHGVATYPPIKLITREVRDALAALPRSGSVAPHWAPMHGDLTPWNLRRLQDGRLALIDWEDAQFAPPGADEVLYHVTSAGLRLPSLPPPIDCEEAIDFWRKRIGSDPNRGAAEVEHFNRVLDALESPSDVPVVATQDAKRARVLIFAYACEPGRGSEPGGGWGVVRTLARFADCVVLVGPEHEQGIAEWRREHPDQTAIEFCVIPELPRSGLAKYHRITWFALYLFWLRAARGKARELHAMRPFDTVAHVSYSVYWLPTPATDFGVPCVWGPVGGAVTTPLALWPALGWSGIIDEAVDFCSVRLSAFATRLIGTWRDASVRLVNNEETLALLPQKMRMSTRVLNHVLFAERPRVAERSRESYIFSFAALHARKGVLLSLRALAHAPEDVKLVIEGDGPERARLEALADKLGVKERVQFIGRISRDELFEQLATCAAAVFTGLREEGGQSLAEAMLCGTPVIVLANGGARTVASLANDPSRVALIAPAGIEDTARGIAHAMTRFSRNPPLAKDPMIDQSVVERTLRRAFDEACPSPRS